MSTPPSNSSANANQNVLLDSVFIAINIENIMYGMELLLYFKTVCVLLSDKGAHRKSKLLYVLFSSAMVLLVTVWVVIRAIFAEKMLVLESKYPGGPYHYWKTQKRNWYMGLAMSGMIILQLMTDALMIYRCRNIWNSYRIIIVPVILWVATLSLGVSVACAASSPASKFQPGLASNISIAYWSVAVFLNTILTCMICYRVLRHGRRVQVQLGHEYATLYFSVAAIVVESVLPYTLSGITFLVALGVKSPTSAAFISVYFLMMCISPQMLILRVVAGKAWVNDTFHRPSSTLKFTPEDTETSHSCAAVGQEGICRHCRTSIANRLGNGKISEV